MGSHDEIIWRVLQRNAMQKRLQRRQFLRMMAAAGVGALTVPLLSACGEEDEDPTPTAGAGGANTPGTTSTPGTTGGATYPGYDNPEKWRGRTLTVTSFGGAYQDAQREAIFTPFANATGCEIREDTTDTVKLKAMVDSGSVEWDVSQTEIESVRPLSEDGLIQPIDYNVVNREGLYDEVALEYTVGAIFWSTVLAYNAESLGDTVPEGWADFWDLSGIPGGRALNRTPQANLEFALLADGVPKDQIYPIDVDRAFAKLDEIKDGITVWWERGAQPPQLLTDKEVVMSSAWNGRISAAQAEGAPLDIQWNGGRLTFDCWVVPEGAPNADVAMDFINFATRAQTTADLAKRIPYGPVNQGAFEMLDEELRDRLPSEPRLREMQIRSNIEWWWENLVAMDERFNTWVLE